MRGPTSQADNKRFQTVRAQLALHGYALARTPASDGPQRLYIERNGSVSPVPSLEVASALLQQVQAGASKNQEQG